MNRWISPLVVFLSMGAWALLHSWLATLSTKAMFERLAGEGIRRYYRLMYVTVAVITLLPGLAMVVFLPSRLLWVIPTPWLYLTLSLQGLALLGLLITVLQVDTLAFIGLRQLRQPDVEAHNKLVTRGFYRWVRHPLYCFSLVLLWLFPYMTDLTLAFIIAASLYFLIGTVPEERKLVAVYGESYRQYQREVPRMIPFLKIF
ncbi:MAG: methyltransferase family protein [Brevefilum sp.]